LIIVILLVLAAGEAILARAYHVTTTPPGQPRFQSLLSQLVAAIVGRGALCYVTSSSIVLVLCLSAYLRDWVPERPLARWRPPRTRPPTSRN
jgi:hypothetical protein